MTTRNSIIRIMGFLVIAIASLASDLPASANPRINGAAILAGTAIEGGLIIARTAADNKVMLDALPVPVASDGLFVIGFHRDSDTAVDIQIIQPDGQVAHTTVTPQQRSYDIQRIDGLKDSMVTPPEAVLKRIKADQAAVAAARQQTAPAGDFWQGFDWPVIGRISGVFGSQRILNGAPRQPHYGIDIAAPKGTPIRAPASGTVTLVKDLYFSGWTVIVNHGLGLNSSFLHMDSVTVHAGDRLARGATLGTVGSSGRSTGAHLDWRLDWQGRRIDAGLAAGTMPQVQ